jgi:hypothetical protein
MEDKKPSLGDGSAGVKQEVKAEFPYLATLNANQLKGELDPCARSFGVLRIQLPRLLRLLLYRSSLVQDQARHAFSPHEWPT